MPETETLQQVVGCKIGLVSWSRPATSAASRWVWGLQGASTSTLRGGMKPWSWVFAVPWLWLLFYIFHVFLWLLFYIFLVIFVLTFRTSRFGGSAIWGSHGRNRSRLIGSAMAFILGADLYLPTLRGKLCQIELICLFFVVSFWLWLCDRTCQIETVSCHWLDLALTLAVTLIFCFPLIVFHPVQLVGQTTL